MKILVAYDGSKARTGRSIRLGSWRSNGADVSVISVAEPLPQFGRAGAMLVPRRSKSAFTGSPTRRRR